MSDVLETVARWSARGDRVALATVVETKRSAPQPIGTKMAVNDRGEVAGAVSGGCVEGAVVEVAETILGGGAPQLLRYGIADAEAWDVGLPCGGEIAVWAEDHDAAPEQARFLELARGGARVALVTVVGGAREAGAGDGARRTGASAAPPDPHAPADPHAEAPRPGAKLLVGVGGALGGTLGDDELDAAALALAQEALWSERSGLHELAGATLYVDVAAPPPRLVIVGAVDFAAQLSAVAALAGWRAFVIDPRARFATAERFPAAERVIVAWPQEAFAELAPLDPATAIAILTHDPKLDDAALLAALASPAGYIGAMGSRRAQARRRERLVAAGVDERQLERISAPIGLDLGALTAAETALSIMGEIVALRHGREGGRLVAAGGRIHEAVAT
ncbi:XdhC family protein [Conexibacter arvalis]|uniref:Xanthine dehydrogenase accessory factor n=1 Tax=Conexibacter arvalis TaxID=912552 RepID=A0A840IIR0_9ACTN|nr:XdhC/CoxI family protein [Conexibacter arvalis]MBB4664872.1 xanthine dehydrogenase accessory factor [Conexibacter arvalis]